MILCEQGHHDCDRYDHDRTYRILAESLTGRTITIAKVIERSGMAFLQAELDDGRTLQVGVSGGLHDEAYLMFDVYGISNTLNPKRR